MSNKPIITVHLEDGQFVATSTVMVPSVTVEAKTTSLADLTKVMRELGVKRPKWSEDALAHLNAIQEAERNEKRIKHEAKLALAEAKKRERIEKLRKELAKLESSN
jgi:hypothetical protein